MRRKRCSSLDLQIKGAENEHYSQKAEKKKLTYRILSENSKIVHMDIEKKP